MPTIRPLTVVLLLTATTAAADAQDVARLGAVFAGGVLDLKTQPKRDVTASFAALISAPIGYPEEKRAAEFNILSLAIPQDARTFDPKFAAEAPSLVAICASPNHGTEWKIEALVQGRTLAWTMVIGADINPFGTPADATHPPQFYLAGLIELDEPAAKRAASHNCNALKRDAAGEVFIDQEPAPIKFEAKLGTPWASGSDHLLDFATDPDRAVGGLMPAEIFASLHRELPRPRAAGVLSLAQTADALSLMGSLTLVGTPPPPATDVIFSIDGRGQLVRIAFKNGYFTTPQVLPSPAALEGAWSKWSWSLVDPRMPAEVLLEMSPAAARCLDALPRTPDQKLATKVEQCLDLSLHDAGTSFRVRRERWLEPVRALELSAANSVESFCGDQEALAKVPFFHPRPAGKNRDAGLMFSAKLGWEKRLNAKAVPGSLRLPDGLERKFAASGFMEISLNDLGAAVRTDTSFLTRLADFDRWELVDNGGPLLKDAKLNAAEAPLPDFAKLSLVARLHLRRAVISDRLVRSAADVRHAARLAFSTENLIGQLNALDLLTIERRAWEWAQKHKVNTAGWTPIDEETITRARRALRTAPAFFSPMAQEETTQRALACDQVARCSGLTEVVAVSAGLETLLREPWKARHSSVLERVSRADDRCSFALARYWSIRPMVDVTAARLSRNQEVIAGGMMSTAATADYVPVLQEMYGQK